MPHTARYILPQHATLRGPHTREELYQLVHRGSMGRGEIVYDQTTKRAHRVGDLIQGMSPPPARSIRPAYRELEGDAPWSDPPSAAPQVIRPLQPAATPLSRPRTIGEAMASRTQEEEDSAPIFAWEERAQSADHRSTPPLSFHKESQPSGHYPADKWEEDEDLEEEEPLSDEEEEEDSEQEEEGAEESAAPRRFYLGHPSWLSYGRWLILSIICIAAGVLCIEQFSLTALALGIILSCLILSGCIIDRMHQDYVINAERVEMVWGLIGRSSKEVRIVDIRSIDVIQHGLLGFLGIGTVEFSSSGTDGVEVHFKHVRSPHKIKELVRKLQKITSL